MVTYSVLLHLFTGCEHFDHHLSWHHCLLFLAKCFLAVPLQFGCSEPHGVPQHGAILRFVVKALGSVEHEGPTTSNLLHLPGFEHRGLHVVLPSVRWSNVLWPSWEPSTLCGGQPRFYILFLLRLVAFSRPSPRSSPSSWPDTAPFSLLSFDATGKSLPRWRLSLAQ